MSDLEVLGRSHELFVEDFELARDNVGGMLRGARILIFGGAGSIGREVARKVAAEKVSALHVVDISENGLVELVRDLRSSGASIPDDAQFLPLDMGSIEVSAFLSTQAKYDYTFNLAAMKHVRSEKDPFSLMRMVKVNVLDTAWTLDWTARAGGRRYFAVSTDKAQNPFSLMGATKRIMEDLLFTADGVDVTTARFANVAFSDGSLLDGFRQRLLKKQPLSAPRDVKRYFILPREAAGLCVLAACCGAAGEIYFPNAAEELELTGFPDIAKRLLAENGFEAVEVESEGEARRRFSELVERRQWPCFFFDSDTAGEKGFEEFYGTGDRVNWNRYQDIAIISTVVNDGATAARVKRFRDGVSMLRERGVWSKDDLKALIGAACPQLTHRDSQRSLDQRM